MLLVLCLIFWGGESAENVAWIPSTDVFHPLGLDEAMIRPDGGAYVLDFRGAHIDIYSPDGEPIKQIGRKGAGPGEFVYPSSMYQSEGRFYVYDKNNNSISIFRENGDFIDRRTFPERNILVEKVAGGWAVANWDGRGHTGPRSLYFLDESLENQRLLLQVKDYGRGGGLYATTSEGKRHSEFGGVSRRAKILASADGKSVYVSDPLKFKIRRISVADGSLLGEITRDEPAIPFDDDWAERKLLAYLDGSDIPASEVSRDFPSHFPSIRSMFLDPDGNLVVDRWRGKPDKKHYPVAYDDEGREIELVWPFGVLQRVVGKREGMVYLTVYDPESEEGGLARVSQRDMLTFLEANPIRYRGQVLRAISSSRVQ